MGKERLRDAGRDHRHVGAMEDLRFAEEPPFLDIVMVGERVVGDRAAHDRIVRLLPRGLDRHARVDISLGRDRGDRGTEAPDRLGVLERQVPPQALVLGQARAVAAEPGVELLELDERRAVAREVGHDLVAEPLDHRHHRDDGHDADDDPGHREGGAHLVVPDRPEREADVLLGAAHSHGRLTRS